MKNIVLMAAIFMINFEVHAKFFLRSSHQIFYNTLKDAASHTDAKVVWLVMLGCPRLQKACMNSLWEVPDRLLSVRLLTDTQLEDWNYPYFSRPVICEIQGKNYQSALILNAQSKPLIGFKVESNIFKSNFKIFENPQDLEFQKQKFEEKWESLRHDR